MCLRHRGAVLPPPACKSQGWASLNGAVQWPGSRGSESGQTSQDWNPLGKPEEDVLLEAAFSPLRRQSSRLAPPRAGCSGVCTNTRWNSRLCLVETMRLNPRWYLGIIQNEPNHPLQRLRIDRQSHNPSSASLGDVRSWTLCHPGSLLLALPHRIASFPLHHGSKNWVLTASFTGEQNNPLPCWRYYAPVNTVSDPSLTHRQSTPWWVSQPSLDVALSGPQLPHM